MLATLYDVAREAGVSTATVSRVIHGHDRVRPATRARVQAVIEALGYVPDSAAQSLSRRRKEVIGLVSLDRLSAQSDIESMGLLFADEVLHGVEATLREKGWSLLITFLQASEPAFSRLEKLLGKVDGLLVAEGIVSAPELARLARRVPLVVISGAQADPVADVVAVDNRSGIAALVTHLIEDHGRRRLFFVAGPEGAPDARERRLAFDEIVAAHDGAETLGVFEGIFSAESGHEAVQELLVARSGALPDAIVCANDQMAIGAIRALSSAGISIPGKVAVVGFDDVYPGALAEPALTTVRQPMRELGAHACARLLDRLAASRRLPVRVEVLPTELVLRASCGCRSGAARRSVVAPFRPVARPPRGRARLARAPGTASAVGVGDAVPPAAPARRRRRRLETGEPAEGDAS